MIARIARFFADRRVLGVLLAVSVALNLFLGGMAAGRFAGQANQALQAKRNLEEVLAGLPEGKREVVRKELRRAMADVRRDFRAMQEARLELAREFAKPQPDGAAVDRHFADVRARTTAMQDALQQAFKRAAVNLTPEERRAVIEAAKKRGAKGLPEL